MRNQVAFTDEALQSLSRISKRDRATIKEAIQVHLMEGDPLQQSRHKFRLRRLSTRADYELRVGAWRIFYTVTGANEVVIRLIGQKRGNVLLINGEEFEL